MAFVRLLYPRGDKLEKVCIGYNVQPNKSLNPFKESEYRVSIQIVLYIFYLQINNIQKYYSISLVFLPLLLCLHQHKQTTSIPVLYFQTSLISLFKIYIQIERSQITQECKGQEISCSSKMLRFDVLYSRGELI